MIYAYDNHIAYYNISCHIMSYHDMKNVDFIKNQIKFVSTKCSIFAI